MLVVRFLPFSNCQRWDYITTLKKSSFEITNKKIRRYLLHWISSYHPSFLILQSDNSCLILSSYLFSNFTDTIRKPMKIGCAKGGSHLHHILTVSSASDSVCFEQLTSHHIIICRNQQHTRSEPCHGTGNTHCRISQHMG